MFREKQKYVVHSADGSHRPENFGTRYGSLALFYVRFVSVLSAVDPAIEFAISQLLLDLQIPFIPRPLVLRLVLIDTERARGVVLGRRSSVAHD